MLENAQTALYNTVFQYRAWGNVDRAAFCGYNDYRTFQGHVTAQIDGSSDGEMVQLHDTGNAGNALLEVRNLLEV